MEKLTFLLFPFFYREMEQKKEKVIARSYNSTLSAPLCPKKYIINAFTDTQKCI